MKQLPKITPNLIKEIIIEKFKDKFKNGNAMLRIIIPSGKTNYAYTIYNLEQLDATFSDLKLNNEQLFSAYIYVLNLKN
jgi:hypothetical protein